MYELKNIFSSFIHFIKYPNLPVYPTISSKQKVLNICSSFLFLHFVVSGLILWYPVAFAEKIGLFNTLSEKKENEEIVLIILSAIFIAPIIEEWLFRYPLGLYRNKHYFKWLYYFLSFLFGLIHIFTYNIDRTHIPYIPFITLTQTFSGFMFGYIRIVYGFWYGVLLHALFNTLGLIWDYFFGFNL